MKTTIKTSDQEKLHGAFKAMRKSGVKATLGVSGCCRSCIWDEMTNVGTKPWADKPVIWFYSGQGNQLKYDFDDNLTSHSALYLNHNAEQFPDEIAACAKILADFGLKTEWDGTHSKCITLVFE